jgi:hypothetical protein
MNAGETLAAVSMLADYIRCASRRADTPCPSSVALLAVSKEPGAAHAMIAFMTPLEAAPLLRKT